MEYRVQSGYLRPLHKIILGHRCPAVDGAGILPMHLFPALFPRGELTVENLRRLVSTSGIR